MSLADWYLALFSIGVGVSLPAYWLILDTAPDRYHLVSEVLTGLVLLAAGLAMVIGNEDAPWVRVLSGIGLGMLVYALVDSPGRYPGDPRKQALFATGWLFIIPALVIRFVTL